MPTLDFTVRDKVIIRDPDNEHYVNGNSDYVIHLNLDQEWAEFVTITARLRWISGSECLNRDIVFTGTSFDFPIIYNVKYVELGIFAGNKHTTTPGIIVCDPCILDGNPTEDEPDPDVYAQILDLIQEGAVKGMSPYIGENLHWYEWDTEQHMFVDTGSRAEGVKGHPGIYTNSDIEMVEDLTLLDVAWSKLSPSPTFLDPPVVGDPVFFIATSAVGVITAVRPTTISGPKFDVTYQSSLIGEQGPQGPRGDKGPVGIYNNYSIALTPVTGYVMSWDDLDPVPVSGQPPLVGASVYFALNSTIGEITIVNTSARRVSVNYISSYKGIQGPQGLQGETGPQGPQGPQGDDYVLTSADKQEIAGIVVEEGFYTRVETDALLADKIDVAKKRVYLEGTTAEGRISSTTGEAAGTAYDMHLTVGVVPGKTYYVSGTAYDSKYTLIVEYDENDAIIGGYKTASSATAIVDAEFTVPPGCVKIVVNGRKPNANPGFQYPSVYSIENAEQTGNTIDAELKGKQSKVIMWKSVGTLVDNKYVAMDNSTKKLKEVASTSYCYVKAPYDRTKKYRITGTSAESDGLYLINCVDGSDHFVARIADGNKPIVRGEFEIPEATEYLCVNARYYSSTEKNRFYAKIEVAEERDVTSFEAGKVGVFFGDSITSGNGVQIRPTVTPYQDYPTIVGEILNCTTYNGGIGGASWNGSRGIDAKNVIDCVVSGDFSTVIQSIQDLGLDESQILQYNKIAALDFDDVDFVCFAYGTNDWTSGYTKSNVKNAMAYCFETLLTAYPKLKIYVLTPIYRYKLGTDESYDSDEYVRPDSNLKLHEICEAVIEASRTAHVPCKDMYYESGLSQYNRATYYSDGTHLNAAGYAVYGEAVAKFIESQIGATSVDVPTSLSDLTDDANHRLVTDEEKTTWNAKQSTLVSGQNIKTVNGQSILGSGDLPAGLVDDIKQNGTSIVSNKIANIVLETSLGLDSNNAATATAVRAFVNSSINSLAAFYITSDTTGNAFATKAALTAGPWYYAGSTRTPTQNDYAIVTADETHDGKSARYLYTGAQWSFQYTFGATFTQGQIDAMNSGITSVLRQAYDAHLADTSIHVTSAERSSWSSKQDAITDLSTIRSGAALGETALQSVPNTYRTAAAQDLIDGAQDVAIAAKYTKPSGGIPASDLAEGVVPTALSELTGDSTHRLVTDAEKSIWNAKIAFSNLNKNGPTRGEDETLVKIFDPTEEKTYFVPQGTYSKPLTGIPASDLASAVQTSLGLADTALQSFTETDPTVPSWAKAANKPAYTKTEVGLGNVANERQYSANNPPPYPVTSVNGQTGAVSLNIPTVNNATLTIQRNGTTVATFTANSASNKTANITVPTSASDLGITEFTAAEIDALWESI